MLNLLELTKNTYHKFDILILTSKKCVPKWCVKILTFKQQEARKNVCIETLNVTEIYWNLLENCNYLFFKVKSELQRPRFGSIKVVKVEAARVLKDLTGKGFKHCFNNGKFSWNVAERGGMYIEGDNKYVWNQNKILYSTSFVI